VKIEKNFLFRKFKLILGISICLLTKLSNRYICVIFLIDMSAVDSSDIFFRKYAVDPLNVFFRKFLNPFSAADICSDLRKMGKKVSEAEMEDILDEQPNVLKLQGDLYITRAGAFSGEFFSFVPTAHEVEQGVVVAGDRCTPFIDPCKASWSVKFSVNGQILPSKVLDTDLNNLCEYFALSDDFAVQNVAIDPANEHLHISENDYEIPPRYSLTGADVSSLFRQFDFKCGDRILAYVADWDSSVVEIFPLKAFLKESENKYVHFIDYEIARNEWYECLENALLQSFDYHGSCDSIERQLVNVFYDNRKSLCVPLCGSVNEFLRKSDKISVEFFGSELRLWKKGESVPIDSNLSFDDIVYTIYDVPFFLIDCFLLNEFYLSHKNSKDKSVDDKTLEAETVRKIIPDSLDLSPKERDFFTLQIKNRRVTLKKSYNWFADFAFGAFRQHSVEVFSELRDFLLELECSESEFKKLPQQEFAVLFQMFEHIEHILESLADYSDVDGEDGITETEFDEMRKSVEVIELNLEDIRPILLDAYEKIQRERFSIV